jgi:nitrite reductase/ring-hydroxylating ferredoxin subunit
MMVAVAAAEEVGEGQVLLFEVGERQVLLTRCEDEILATEPRCPHARSVLGPGRLAAGGLVECPMHGALFSPRDGARQEDKGPSCAGLETYPVEVRDGTVHVDFEAARPRPPAPPSPGADKWGNWSAAAAR